MNDLLFLGLAKNCARTIPKFAKLLDRLEISNYNVRAIIGENGSRDNTRSVIRSFYPRITPLDTSFMGKERSRLRRIAMGREALLQKAKGLKADYVIVSDFDNVMEHPPRPDDIGTAIAHLQADPKLFAVGATSMPCFYDLLALRGGGIKYDVVSLME